MHQNIYITDAESDQEMIVVDKRRQSFFIVQNDIIDYYLSECKIDVFAFAVYSVLLRLAGNKIVAFPSIMTICNYSGIKKTKCIEAINALIDQKLIKKIKRKKKESDCYLSNYYQILDIILPEKSEGGSSPHELPSSPHELGVVRVANPINTHLDKYSVREDARAHAYIEQEGARIEKFRMATSWKPDKKTLRARLTRAGLRETDCTDADVQEIIGYWEDEQRSFTEGQWQTKLISQIKRRIDHEKNKRKKTTDQGVKTTLSDNDRALSEARQDVIEAQGILDARVRLKMSVETITAAEAELEKAKSKFNQLKESAANGTATK